MSASSQYLTMWSNWLQPQAALLEPRCSTLEVQLIGLFLLWKYCVRREMFTHVVTRLLWVFWCILNPKFFSAFPKQSWNVMKKFLQHWSRELVRYQQSRSENATREETSCIGVQRNNIMVALGMNLIKIGLAWLGIVLFDDNHNTLEVWWF